MKDLGRLERCRIRDVWSVETDFSDWLFSEENMELLSESIGLESIDAIAREDSVGKYRADIVGETSESGKVVIIENQFEESDHDHLGKIITYAAGKDASFIVWIVENARPEHASAIEWLNNNLSDKGFFLIEIELWRIGNSLPAPKFNIVERPNEWIQMAKTDTDSTKSFKYAYWQQFLDYVKDNKKFVKCYPGTGLRKPTSDHWYSFSKGCNGGFKVETKIFTHGGRLEAVATDIWIREDKDLYYRFESKKAEIESELGFQMEWDEKENKKASSIRVKRDVDPGESMESTFDWLIDKAIRMKEVFNKYS